MSPDALSEQLAGRGRTVSRAALKALVAEAYRAHRLTGVEVCQLLDIPSRNDLDASLKSHGVPLEYTHGVPLEYTIEDFEREGQTSTGLRQLRQAELAHLPSR
jgi:hypothetical protein